MSTRIRKSPFELRLAFAPNAFSMKAMPGHELVDLKSLGLILPMQGGALGYNDQGGVITKTSDGRDISGLWDEFQSVVAIYNERRQKLVDLLTYSVTQNIEDVPQLASDDFEEASEFGEPKGIRAALTYFSMAYDFKWYDLAARFTWKFLAEASASQVEAIHQSALEADSRLVFKKVMSSIFNNVTRGATINGQNYNVYPLYNNDGTIPPPYKGTVFDGTHTHYLSSGAALIDSGDLETMYGHLKHHGYSIENGTTVVAMLNSVDATEVKKFRANVVNNNSTTAVYDFVPAVGQPGLIVPNVNGLLGSQPANTFQGFTVIGSYGNILIVEEDYIPAGYVLMFGSGGDGDLQNVVGIREHANPELRGLRLIGGDKQGYPLIDSYYNRGFGTGIRQRGAAVVMRISASAYAVPAAYNA